MLLLTIEGIPRHLGARSLPMSRPACSSPIPIGQTNRPLYRGRFSRRWDGKIPVLHEIRPLRICPFSAHGRAPSLVWASMVVASAVRALLDACSCEIRRELRICRNVSVLLSHPVRIRPNSSKRMGFRSRMALPSLSCGVLG